ncbi:hypothetical protein LWI28_014581 [Acer negundo]|uniref:PB1-like domain-containing protein n=1 Tax=Acer negundo TaxID=4023 RepID=A0AAD5NUM7_ACENE|nr:hypothetical protein LWI28_014581 [Acer negundo]
MVVYHGGVFVYADDNIVGYVESLCDIFKEVEFMSIMDLDKMCAKLGYEKHVFYWRKAHGEGPSVPIEEEEVVAVSSKGLGEQKRVEET